MFLRRALVFFLLAQMCAALPAYALWRQIDSLVQPEHRIAEDDALAQFWAKDYHLWSDGGRCFGDAHANAISPLTSVTYSAATQVGLRYEFWRHFPPGVGEVEVRVRAKIKSFTQSKGPGLGKAAAVGFCSGEYWLDGNHTKVEAVVNKGAANTLVEGLPKLIVGINGAIPGMFGVSASVQIPLVWYNGSGVIRGFDNDYISDFQCPVVRFRFREKAQAQIHVWAMGSTVGGRGKAYCEMEGRARVVFDLIDHPFTCP